MKKHNLLIWAVIIATTTTLALTSCGSTSRTLSGNAKELSTNGTLHQSALSVDLEVGEKVSLEKVFKYGEGNLNRSSRSESNEIDVTTAELLTKYNGDVLVERRHTVNLVSDSKTSISTVKVEGYVGRYKNFKTIEAAVDGE